MRASSAMALRELNPLELDAIWGGGATVNFYDNDRNGKLSEGDTIVSYTWNGSDYSPSEWGSLFDTNTSVDWGDVLMDGLYGSLEGGVTGFVAGGVLGGITGAGGGAVPGAFLGGAAGAAGGFVWGAWESYAEQSGDITAP